MTGELKNVDTYTHIVIMVNNACCVYSTLFSIIMYFCRSYASFSVENDELNFSAVERLIIERQNVLADLDFEILELSQGKTLT